MVRDTCGEKEDLLVITRVDRVMFGTSGGCAKRALDQYGKVVDGMGKEGTERRTSN